MRNWAEGLTDAPAVAVVGEGFEWSFYVVTAFVIFFPFLTRNRLLPLSSRHAPEAHPGVNYHRIDSPVWIRVPQNLHSGLIPSAAL